MQSNARKNGLNTVLLTFTLHSYFLCIGRHNIASFDEHDLRRSGADSKRKIPYETDGGR